MALESHAPVDAVAALWTKRRVHFRPSIGELIGYGVLAGIPSIVFGIVAPCAGLYLLSMPIVICLGRYYLCPSVSIAKETVRVRGWGLLSVESRKLEQLDTITLNPPLRNAAPYTLQLDGDIAALNIPMVATTYLEAREYAERIAGLLRLDILDKALGRTIRRSRAARFESNAIDDFDSSELSIFAKGLDEDPDVLPLRREVHFGTRLLMLVPRFIAIYVALCLIPTVRQPLRPHLKAFSTLLVVSTIAMFAVKRSGVILDRNAHVARPWWIHPVRPFYRSLHLDRYLAVVLIKEFAPTMSNFRACRYSILLDGFCLPLRLQQTRDVLKAQYEADRVAEFLHLTLVDLTQDQPAEAPVQKQELRNKIAPKLFTKPLGPNPEPERLKIERNGNGLLFTVPRSGLRLHHVCAIGLTAGGVLLFTMIAQGCVVDAFGGRRGVDGCGVILSVLMLLANLLMIWGVILPLFRLSSRVERVSVWTDRIHVDVTGSSKQWSVELQRSEMTNLLVIGGSSQELVRELRIVAYNEVVRAEGREKAAEFGVGLTHASRVWLREAIASILVSDLPEPVKPEPVKPGQAAMEKTPPAMEREQGLIAKNSPPADAKGDLLAEFIAECAMR